MIKKTPDKKEVSRIAKLANISLTEREIKKFQKQLGDILRYMDVLDELDTAKIKPTSQVTGLINVLRDDKVNTSFSQEETLSGSKSTYKGFFKVEAIFKNG